jgi:hypothetical protein
LCVLFNGQRFHAFDKILVDRKGPPNQANEKREEDDERDDRPDGYIIDALKDVLIHGFY